MMTKVPMRDRPQKSRRITRKIYKKNIKVNAIQTTKHKTTVLVLTWLLFATTSLPV